jgi:hypothetical protein
MIEIGSPSFLASIILLQRNSAKLNREFELTPPGSVSILATKPGEIEFSE